ncbi:uncharacterized protein LOC126355777 [Schistocerca gregaria]|uniref:uncharacterized protein LOC126355777 n=1 Tax=Schistocerca gregaria TaxID=7010 RepID=UPI00211F0A89|nr:uncharacterized protein LOC126355777 [Schistocerca gregaria]
MHSPGDRTGLERRKESSAAPLAGSGCTTPDEPPLLDDPYPFALVLRLRVLQIVCGISAMVMGTVTFIEERGALNLGLGIPAGAATVAAAAASIHSSRGFGGYRPRGPSRCRRCLGPSTPAAALWGCACALHAALLVQAARTAVSANSATEDTDLTVLAAVLLCLAAGTLSAECALLRVDWRYDPD